MRPLKLRTKTTLLASTIAVAVFFTALVLISTWVANRIRQEQKEVADLVADDFADQINDVPAPRNAEMLGRLATLVRRTHPNMLSVRIWERSGGVFVARAAAAGSAPAVDIPERTKEALRSGGLPSQVVNVVPSSENGSLYRVFAPITEQGRVSGAVEVVMPLDRTSNIAWRYAMRASWIVLVAVVLMTLGIYLLFRRLIYRPLASLLAAMSRAKAGDLETQASLHARDELGQLSLEFNNMLGQLRTMTKEREAQREVLRQRVREATKELQWRNEQLRDTNLELWRTTRRLTEFERFAVAGQTAAQFAHEVGTPLNLISGHVQLLRANLRTDPHAAELRIQTIEEQIERIEGIVRQMLDRTRFEAAGFSQLDLNALLHRTFDATAPTLDAQSVRLVTKLEPELPSVAGDADRLQQVLINLINNALDAMPGGGELRVKTYCERLVENRDDAPHVVLEIADTGCGMTAETRAQIFKPLYTTKGRGQGTGLGLVIVNQIVRDHGGGIEVESEPGRGTLFSLWFPASPIRQGKRPNEAAIETGEPADSNQ